MDDTYHGQSTKQQWRADIEESRKHKPIYKIWEFLDDYTYGDSNNMGILLSKFDEENILVLFMEYGPKTTLDLRKMLEWRKSGKTTEIGHKGGGNLRNIYGHKSKLTSLVVRLNDTKCLFAETYVNKIYDFSILDITETAFNERVNTSEFVNVPQEKNINRIPSWYIELYDKM